MGSIVNAQGEVGFHEILRMTETKVRNQIYKPQRKNATRPNFVAELIQLVECGHLEVDARKDWIKFPV